MPRTEDIRNAIAAGDRELASQLYREVLAKNDGKGLSGHDQQILKEEIESLPKKRRKDSA